jgi:hypothetical protein
MADTGFFDNNEEKNPLKPGKIPDPLNRHELSCISSEVVRSIFKQVRIAKFKGQSDDAKLSYIRACIQAIKAHSAIMKDDEIEEMKIEIADLKQIIGEDHGRNQ